MNRFLDSLNASMLAERVRGELSGSPEAMIRRARADSRLCRPGDLYVALPGERVDGIEFVESAWEEGAEVVLSRRSDQLPTPPQGKALVQVEDALAGLHEAALNRRREAENLDVVGITGSNGKTTTKNILAAIALHWRAEEVLVTEGNYNSDIGLPLTLFDLRSRHRLAVLELGMNRVGEMELLARLALPRVAVITNIGRAHVGMVGSVEALAKEKRAIFSTADSSSVAVVGALEPWKDFLLEGYPGKVRYFGEWGENGWEDFDNLGAEGFLLRRNGDELLFPLPGHHNLVNAMAAVEAALALGAPEASVRAGLAAVRPAFGRSEIIHGEITVLRDYYNANPESMAAALELFVSLAVSGRRIVVLGELLELGEETDKALWATGGAVADAGPDAVFLFGESLSPMEEALVSRAYPGLLRRFTDIDQLGTALADYCRPGDAVLLKGSRGSALERLDQALVKSGAG